MTGSTEPVIVGEVTGVFGIKGWIKLHSYTDPPEQIAQYRPWQLSIGGQWQSLEVEQVQRQGKSVVAKLAGIDDRDRAAELMRCSIAIDPQQLPVLPENEFYWRDLQGLQVINLKGVELGTVQHLLETGANDVLVVRNAENQEILIPYVPDRVIHSVDIESGIIRVDWEADF